MRPTSSRLIALLLVAACGGTVATPRAARPPAPPGAAPARTAPSSAPPAPRVAAVPELVAIDLFGTRQLTLESLLASHGDELRTFAAAMMRDDPDVDPEVIAARIRALGDFAYVEPALIGYFEPEGMKYYLTIDVVDRQDASRRLAFLPAPTGTHPDPGGLLADWKAYEDKSWELMNAGEMKPDRVDCAAFHCFGDQAHPALAPLASKLITGVPAHAKALAAILRDDRSSEKRAAAAYLLAYTQDGAALVALLTRAFRDDSSFVRNSAMRVVADIALHHPEVEIPVEPVLDALAYPATSDRNKAAAILAGILDRPGASRLHRRIATRAGATLLAMLRLEQPNNHTYAYRILKAISGQTFGERDYGAWEAWLAQIVR